LTIDVNGTGSNGNLSVINASASTANVNIFGTNGLDRAATVTGGSGNDTLAGSTSADNISGGAGNDVIAGLNGNDTLAGGTGNDSITSGTGNDVVTGGDGNDTIVGAGGTDNMDGGAGDDTFVFDTIADIGTTDTIVGGDGNDTLSSTGTTINLNSNAFAGVSGIENLSLGGGVTTVTINDTGLGSFGNAIRIVSATGSDHVIDASGVLSSASRVTYVGSTGAETYRLGNGIDSVSLGAGNDTVTVSTVALLGTSDVVGGGSGTGDAIRFTEVVGAATTLSAAQLATLSGFEVLDIDVAGTAGGNYVVNLTDSFLSANNNAGAFQVSRTGGGGDGTADTGTLSVNASTVSATYNITLIGADGNDSLVGGAGNDVIAGNGGTDTLTGGAGNDDFQVANNTTRDVITDFNFGTATATGAVDQIQILDAYLGGTNGADGSAGFQTGTNFGTVVLSADGATGVGSTTDVVVITGRSFNSITELDTVIETLNATNVTQDFFVIYQDGLGTVRVAIAESDGAEGGTDFTVTDAFQLTGVTVTGIASLVDVSDFIIV
jgi:Ca2+-binding RTX toxin-like protein